MKSLKLISLLASAAIATSAAPALADWKTVETDHFIYHSEDDVEDIEENVKNLEVFDSLVRALTGNTAQPSTVKVRIFELRDMDTLNRLIGTNGVGGFYNNNDMGPYIFTFRQPLRNKNTLYKTNDNTVVWAPEVRQHEYLHHYMYQYFNANYPSWYSEGFAEYYGTMAFPEEGVVEIGHAPHFRMNAIRGGSWVDMETLLTARSYAEIDDLSALYAQGWLFTHMAARNPERGKQLADYLNRLVKGEAYADAAKAAFGDLDKLNKELRSYRNDIKAVRLSLKPMDIGEVAVTELSEFESDLFTYMVRLNLGVREKDVGQLREHVRNLRNANPDHPMGLEIQARLAFIAEDYDDAEMLAAKMLANDPSSLTGKHLKGQAMLLKLGDDAEESAYEPGRALIAEAANGDPNNPEPLIDFYRSYLIGDGIPPATAQNALMRAYQLLPGHRQVRAYVARDFEWRKMYDDAIHVISPLAFGSFDGDEAARRKRDKAIAEAVEKYGRLVVADTPKEMLERLQAKRDGKWDYENNRLLDASSGATP